MLINVGSRLNHLNITVVTTSLVDHCLITCVSLFITIVQLLYQHKRKWTRKQWTRTKSKKDARYPRGRITKNMWKNKHKSVWKNNTIAAWKNNRIYAWKIASLRYPRGSYVSRGRITNNPRGRITNKSA